MKKILLSLLVMFIIASCGKKQIHKNDDLTYYGADYKGKDVTVLNSSSADIDAIWFEFYQKDANSKDYNRYTLLVKSNGVISKEAGSCNIDWNNQITFMPDSGTTYFGTWTSGKEKYKIVYNIDSRKESLMFVYKKTSKCKKGK